MLRRRCVANLFLEETRLLAPRLSGTFGLTSGDDCSAEREDFPNGAWAIQFWCIRARFSGRRFVANAAAVVRAIIIRARPTPS